MRNGVAIIRTQKEKYVMPLVFLFFRDNKEAQLKKLY